jgi:iron-sulfur cluster assembly accessory protein
MSGSSFAPENAPEAPVVPPPRIRLSAPALEKIREMLEEEELIDEGGIRLSARSGAGCSAPMQFGMTMEARPGRRDVVLAGEGIRVFMDPTSAWSLDGLEVDYVSSPVLGEGFAFRHPNGSSGRAC